MICPQCHAEYRQGTTSCSDCHVLLVAKLPEEALARRAEAEHGDPDEDPFCAFWQGDDPRLHAELCTVLDEAEIPHKTVYRTDHLFNINRYNAFKIGVPFSLFEKAELAVKDAFGTEEEDGSVAVLTLPAPDDLQQQRESPEVENPDVMRPFFAEDANIEVWKGDPPEITDMVRSSLRENNIPARWLELDEKSHLFVLPPDAVRAHEIIREIAEATPPE
jgi:hypothetical protein